MGKEINKEKETCHWQNDSPLYTPLASSIIKVSLYRLIIPKKQNPQSKNNQSQKEITFFGVHHFQWWVVILFFFFFLEGPSLCQWKTITDQSLMVAVGRCRWTTTMDPQEHHPLLMSSGVTVPPMRKPRWVNIITVTGIWRRGRALLVLGRSLLLGLWLILSCRGRRGLLATRCILLRAKWRGPSEKASGGSKLSTANWFMGGPDMLGWGFI